MCIVSDKVKFCTCKDIDLKDQPNTWILYRYNPEKEIRIMGSLAFPAYKYEPEYEINRETFLMRLNEEDAFDVPIDFHEKDRIDISIETTVNGQPEQAFYCYKYHNGKWEGQEYDPFELENHFDELKKGKFINLTKENPDL